MQQQQLLRRTTPDSSDGRSLTAAVRPFKAFSLVSGREYAIASACAEDGVQGRIPVCEQSLQMGKRAA